MQEIEIEGGGIIEFPDDMSDSDILNALKDLPPADFSPASTGQGGIPELPPPGRVIEKGSAEEAARDAYVGESPRILVRPGLTMGGQVAGEFGGLGLGGLTSPVTGPVGPAVGFTTGGGLGYASLNQLADILLGEDKASFGKDFAIGAGTSAVGGALPYVGRGIVSHIPEPVTQAAKTLYEAAGRKIPAMADEFTELISKIPGVRPLLGAGENDELAMIAGRAINSADDIGRVKYGQRLKDNDNAIRAYLDKAFPEGKIDDLVQSAVDIKKAMAEGVTIPSESLETFANSISKLDRSDVLAGKFTALLQKAKDFEKARVGKLWDDLPNIDISTAGLKKGILKLVSDLEKSGQFDVLPPKFINQILSAGDKIPLSQLRGWASTAGRYARGAGRETVEEAANKRLRGTLEGFMEESLPGEYSAVKQAYRNYAGTFREGAVGKALGFGRPVSDLKGMYGLYNPNNPELSDGIIKALGQDEGRDMIRNIALTDLKEKAFKDGSLDPKRYMSWFDRNENLLARHNLDTDFKNYDAASRNLLTAMSEDKAFQKTVLSKITDTNSNEIISGLLSSKDSGAKTQQLIEMIEKDPAALKGLKTALKEHIIANATNKEKRLSGEALTNLMKKYDPVIKRVFTNPEEIEAMHNARKLLSFLERVDPQGKLPGNRILEKFTVGENIPGSGIKSWPVAAELNQMYNQRKMKALFDAGLNPEYAKKLMGRYAAAQRMAGIAPRTGAIYSMPLDSMIDINTRNRHGRP